MIFLAHCRRNAPSVSPAQNRYLLTCPCLFSRIFSGLMFRCTIPDQSGILCCLANLRHNRQGSSHGKIRCSLHPNPPQVHAPAHSRHGVVRRLELERIARRRWWALLGGLSWRSHAYHIARWQPPRRSPRPRARHPNLGGSRRRRTLVVAFGITGRSSQEKIRSFPGRSRRPSRGNNGYR